MIRALPLSFLLAFTLLLSGCGVGPTPTLGHGPPPFAGAVFVSGHYSRNGHWIHGHWI